MSAPVLEVADLVTAYGKIEALRGVSLSVAPGSITCLLGPNGAGKTTLMMTATGLLKPRRGSIRFAGDELAGRAPHEIVARGVALVPENRLVFPTMTVTDNLAAGAYQRRDKVEIAQDVERMFARFPRLKERSQQQAGTLSGGEQQMAAIGRGLMSKPRLIMLDEPSLGLSPILVADIFRVIKEVHDAGVTVLLVEQNVFKSLQVADRAYVLGNGRIVLSGTGAALLADDNVRQAYLGL